MVSKKIMDGLDLAAAQARSNLFMYSLIYINEIIKT